jgi:glutathione synthase/RimK-type ligase-like ATP-grasp enzyme
MTWKHVIVVDERDDWRWEVGMAEILTVDDYLGRDPVAPNCRIINLCREHNHLSAGYYVSLIAAARGHVALPDMRMLADLEHQAFREKVRAELERLLLAGPMPFVVPATFSVHVYFGQTDHPAFRELARRAFELLRAPLLRLDLEKGESWRIAGLRLLGPQEVPKAHDALVCVAMERLGSLPICPREKARRPIVHSREVSGSGPKRVTSTRFDLAVLVNPEDKIPPSKSKALTRLADVGRKLRIEVRLIKPPDFGDAHFDALFIRETTAVSNLTYRFAREAEEKGIPVLDDSASIIRCTNKVFLSELMRHGAVPTPPTRPLTRRTLANIAREHVFPVVVKMPDGSFSKGVELAADRAELRSIVEAMLARSHVVIVQDFLRTEFDWRIGVLGGEALFAARYFMCDQHWQILKHAPDGTYVEGLTQAIATSEVPPRVLDAALRAARLVGEGLYGVDLKETSQGVFVMEVNDNPNIDVGLEDAVLGDELYCRLLLDFARRVETSRRDQAKAELVQLPRARPRALAKR